MEISFFACCADVKYESNVEFRNRRVYVEGHRKCPDTFHMGVFKIIPDACFFIVGWP